MHLVGNFQVQEQKRHVHQTIDKLSVTALLVRTKQQSVLCRTLRKQQMTSCALHNCM